MFLLVINKVCGFLFIIFTIMRFDSVNVGLAFLIWSMFWLILPYLTKRLRLKNADQSLQSTIEKENMFDRQDSKVILVLNLCTYLVLWFYPTIVPVHVVDFLIAYFPFPFCLLILYWDSERLGRRSAQIEFRDRHQIS